MTNQTPAEATIIRLLQEYALSLGCTTYLAKPKEQREAVEKLTAYAATVEREAYNRAVKLRPEVIGMESGWNRSYQDGYNTGTEEYAHRLAALQGPQDDNAD